MKYCVGLTGSIASGKTTVGKMFVKLGADLVCSDTVSRQLTQKNHPILQIIADHFGKEILIEDGNLNRKKLREIIFRNPSERIWLENLLHPEIRKELLKKIQEGYGTYCIVDIPLLYKKEDYPWLDRILVVTARESLAIERIMTRDHSSEETAKKILDHQKSQVNYEILADDLLVNEGDLDSLEGEVRVLHELYLRLSSPRL